MALPRIAKNLNEKGILFCGNCLQPLYKYDFKYYPRRVAHAFKPLVVGVTQDVFNQECPFCEEKVLRK